MYLSKNFPLETLVRSDMAARLGIDNTPDSLEIIQLRRLCNQILEPLVEAGFPLSINSGFRSLTLNRQIGSKDSSQHVRGQAADIECSLLSTKELAQEIIDMKLPFDQLILELYKPDKPKSGWVHVSVSDAPRGEVLRTPDGKFYFRGLG